MRLDFRLLVIDDQPSEIDEAIGSRPPVRSGLGPLGELLTAVVVVAALLAILFAGAFVLGWIFR